VSSTRCALQSNFHLLQVQSERFFNLRLVSHGHMHARPLEALHLWVRLLLLSQPYSEVLRLMGQLLWALLPVPAQTKKRCHVERKGCGAEIVGKDWRRCEGL
jgi:hypothetical protein